MKHLKTFEQFINESEVNETVEVNEGKFTKRDVDKITDAVNSFGGIVGVKQHPEKKDIILVGYNNYNDRSKLKRAVQEAGYEYVTDGRSTNSPLFHSNWIAFKLQESVNNIIESFDNFVTRNKNLKHG